tara:strand:+ start:319 stop:435 length:117 start_codon:yes stop_codon:yes gene_type:complete
MALLLGSPKDVKSVDRGGGRIKRMMGRTVETGTRLKRE